MSNVEKAWEKYSKSLKEAFIKGWNGVGYAENYSTLIERESYRSGADARAGSDAQAEMNLAEMGRVLIMDLIEEVLKNPDKKLDNLLIAIAEKNDNANKNIIIDNAPFDS